MLEQIKKFLLLAAVVYSMYWLMTHHIIFFGGRNFAVLDKAKPTFTNTFNSFQDKKDIRHKGLENILAAEDLRNAGLGELLLERGLITQEELDKAEDIIDYGE